MTKWICNRCGNEYDDDHDFNEGFSTPNYEYDLCSSCAIDLEDKIREIIFPKSNEEVKQ